MNILKFAAITMAVSLAIYVFVFDLSGLVSAVAVPQWGFLLVSVLAGATVVQMGRNGQINPRMAAIVAAVAAYVGICAKLLSGGLDTGSTLAAMIGLVVIPLVILLFVAGVVRFGRWAGQLVK